MGIMNPNPLRLASVLLAALWFFATPHDARAQAAGLAPELATHATKYKADADALTPMREQALATVAKPYTEALDAAEQKSTQAGRAEEVKAILEEKKKVSAGRRVGQVAAPQLPKGLAGARTTYLREFERCEREHAARAKQLAADYLRALGTIETAARSKKQDTLLAQIALLKRDLLREETAVFGTGANLVTNGDFSKKVSGDAPDNWEAHGPLKGGVVTEGESSFLRFSTTGERREAIYRQSFDRPPNTKEIAISVRMRCSLMKGPGKIGVSVSERNAAGDYLRIADAFTPASEEIRDWKQFTATVKLMEGTNSVIIRLRSIGALTVVDFDDVRVERR
jgi:hypothetical protein